MTDSTETSNKDKAPTVADLNLGAPIGPDLSEIYRSIEAGNRPQGMQQLVAQGSEQAGLIPSTPSVRPGSLAATSRMESFQTAMTSPGDRDAELPDTEQGSPSKNAGTVEHLTSTTSDDVTKSDDEIALKTTQDQTPDATTAAAAAPTVLPPSTNTPTAQPKPAPGPDLTSTSPKPAATNASTEATPAPETTSTTQAAAPTTGAATTTAATTTTAAAPTTAATATTTTATTAPAQPKIQPPPKVPVVFDFPPDNAAARHNAREKEKTTKALKTWWKGFVGGDKEKKEEADDKDAFSEKVVPQPNGVFGVQLAKSLEYASVQISTTRPDGSLYVWGYVPVVVAKCGLHLKDTATEVPGTFRVSGSTKRMKELQAIFDNPPKYGKNLDWKKHNYPTHDVATILRRYLTQMPEPIIPHELYHDFRNNLETANTDLAGAIKTYQSLIAKVPKPNQYLLLYVLDLLSVFARKSDVNLMTAPNLAVIFQPGIISHTKHEMSPAEHALSQKVLEFLIEHQDHFLLGMELEPIPSKEEEAARSKEKNEQEAKASEDLSKAEQAETAATTATTGQQVGTTATSAGPPVLKDERVELPLAASTALPTSPATEAPPPSATATATTTTAPAITTVAPIVPIESRTESVAVDKPEMSAAGSAAAAAAIAIPQPAATAEIEPVAPVEPITSREPGVFVEHTEEPDEDEEEEEEEIIEEEPEPPRSPSPERADPDYFVPSDSDDEAPEGGYIIKSEDPNRLDTILKDRKDVVETRYDGASVMGASIASSQLGGVSRKAKGLNKDSTIEEDEGEETLSSPKQQRPPQPARADSSLMVASDSDDEAPHGGFKGYYIKESDPKRFQSELGAGKTIKHMPIEQDHTLTEKKKERSGSGSGGGLFSRLSMRRTSRGRTSSGAAEKQKQQEEQANANIVIHDNPPWGGAERGPQTASQGLGSSLFRRKTVPSKRNNSKEEEEEIRRQAEEAVRRVGTGAPPRRKHHQQPLRGQAREV